MRPISNDQTAVLRISRTGKIVVGEGIVEPLYQDPPCMFKDVVGPWFPLLINQNVHDADIRYGRLELKDFSQQPEPKGFRDPDDIAWGPHETLSVDFLSEFQAVSLSEPTAEVDEGFEGLMPSKFVNHETTESEVA